MRKPWQKRKCPLCEKRFWRFNTEMLHIMMVHATDLKARLDAAIEAFKNPPEPVTLEI